MWHKVEERLPDTAGIYRARWRRQSGIIDEDLCVYGFVLYNGTFYWQDRHGCVITSVVEWREE